MSYRRTPLHLPLATILLAACAHSVQTPKPALDAQGRFLRDTLVIANPAHELYAGTTVHLAGDVWRRGAASPDSQAAVHWTVRDVRRGWVAENGTLVLLEHGTITLVAESGVLQAERELEIRENPVAHVQLPNVIPQLAVGDTARLAASVTAENGSRLPHARVHYAVATRGLGPNAGATIDDEGRLVARQPGIYTVLATVGRVSSQALVVVPGGSNRGLSESMDELQVAEPAFQPYVGTFGVMRAEGRPALRNETRAVPARWSTSDSTIARIASDGTVAFVGEGRVTITAEAGGTRAERKLWVRRDAAADMAFRVGEHDIHVGDAVPLGEQVWQKGGTPIRDARVNYGVVSHASPLMPDAVEITEDGVFIARRPGVYTIIAELGGVADQATVVVRRRESVARIGQGSR